MTSRHDDLEAMVAELSAQLPSSTPEMRRILETQIDAVRQTQGMLAAAAPAMAEGARRRAPVAPEVLAFLRPAPPASVPAWLPDDLTRGQVTEAMLACSHGARVYAAEGSVGCAVPQGMGRIPVAHGLQLFFYQSGALTTQSFYDADLLRWSIGYHPLGGRASVGFYADVERLVHLEHGLHTSFAPNGTITSQSEWVQGVRHGWTKLWEDDGHPISATRYDRGRAMEQVSVDGIRRSL